MKHRNPHALTARQRKGGPHADQREKLEAQQAAADVAEALPAREDLPVGRVRHQEGGEYELLALPEVKVPDRDGWPISIGHCVRRPSYEHPLYGRLGERSGYVTAVYRRGGKVIVEFCDPEYAAGSMAYPEMLVRSASKPTRRRISAMSGDDDL